MSVPIYAYMHAPFGSIPSRPVPSRPVPFRSVPFVCSFLFPRYLFVYLCLAMYGLCRLFTCLFVYMFVYLCIDLLIHVFDIMFKDLLTYICGLSPCVMDKTVDISLELAVAWDW